MYIKKPKKTLLSDVLHHVVSPFGHMTALLQFLSQNKGDIKIFFVFFKVCP